MSIDFDFLAPDVQASASAIPPVTVAPLCTVLLATAPFPLQAGRVVEMEIDFVAMESTGDIAFSYLKTIVGPATTSGTLALSQLSSEPTLSGPGGTSAPSLIINGSGDLEIGWGNVNLSGSGITQDVSVRVRCRWVGA